MLDRAGTGLAFTKLVTTKQVITKKVCLNTIFAVVKDQQTLEIDREVVISSGKLLRLTAGTFQDGEVYEE